ncbi:GatB/YqeY domain-containing protein [bacterium]|nr:GatB/YqeY domain-containing protein [Candidatus Elulimicrobium humile]
MSNIALTIKKDMVQAMKDKNDLAKTVLRTLSSEFKNAEIDKGNPLEDADVIKVLSKLEKQRKDSIQAYKDGGREDLVAIEEAELLIIQKYLPAKLTTEELTQLVEESIAELGDNANFGLVMKSVIAKSQGKADGNQIKDLVQAKLA